MARYKHTPGDPALEERLRLSDELARVRREADEFSARHQQADYESRRRIEAAEQALAEARLERDCQLRASWRESSILDRRALLLEHELAATADPRIRALLAQVAERDEKARRSCQTVESGKRNVVTGKPGYASNVPAVNAARDLLGDVRRELEALLLDPRDPSPALDAIEERLQRLEEDAELAVARTQ